MRSFGRLALALLPAGMLGAYGLWPALALLSYGALVPWIVLYADDRRPRVPLVYYAVSAYLAWLLLHLPFFRFGWFPAMTMGAMFFLPWLLFAPVLRRVHERFRLPRFVSVPLIWVALDWVRATFTLAHMDLFQLGYSQARFPVLIQIADTTGVYGVSFLVAAVNGWFADFYLAWRDQQSFRSAWRTGRVVAGAATLAGLFAIVVAYGTYRLATAEHTEGPRLAVVQPNQPHSQASAAGVHLIQLSQTLRQVEPSAADLIVWPENAILDRLDLDADYLEDLAWLAETRAAPMLIGALGDSREPGRTANAAFVIDRQGRVVGEYHKQILFPWSEYVPLDGFLERFAPPLHRLHRSIARAGWGSLASGSAGDQPVLLRMPWGGSEIRFAALICIENGYPPIPSRASRLGARFFVNITSEGLVGGPVQEQLLRICILRAVESRIPYVRAGNTGISCFIDAEGRVRSVLRGERGRTINDAGVLIDRVPLSAGVPTLYARSGDVFALLCVAATGLLLAWSLFRPRSGSSAPAP